MGQFGTRGELFHESLVVHTGSEETPGSTATTKIVHRTAFPVLVALRSGIVVFEQGEECVVLLGAILTKPGGSGGVEAVGVEGKTASFDDQDALGILTEFGIGVKEIAGNDTPSNASANDDDVVFLLCSYLGRESEEELSERFFGRGRSGGRSGGLVVYKLEDPALVLGLM